MTHLSELANRHFNADIYVIGSGVSLEFYDPEFFRDRLTICINWVAHRRPIPDADYTITKYHDIASFMASTYPDMTVVASRHMMGNPHAPSIDPELPNLIAFDTKPGQVPGTGFRVNADWPTDPHQLVNSHSTITSGMHLAAYMGARNIFMVAHDAGLIDGRMHFDGYRLTPDTLTTTEWLAGFDRQSREVKGELQRRYGCRIYGLLPFINARMEGHEYR